MLSSFYKSKIESLFINLDKIPYVYENSLFKEALDQMINNKLGVLCVVNNNLDLKGILTDGDIRRKLIKIQKPLSAFFADDIINHINKQPFTVNKTITVLEAITIMSEKKIWDLPVVENKKLIGILHLNDILKKLINNKI